MPYVAIGQVRCPHALNVSDKAAAGETLCLAIQGANKGRRQRKERALSARSDKAAKRVTGLNALRKTRKIVQERKLLGYLVQNLLEMEPGKGRRKKKVRSVVCACVAFLLVLRNFGWFLYKFKTLKLSRQGEDVLSKKRFYAFRYCAVF